MYVGVHVLVGVLVRVCRGQSPGAFSLSVEFIVGWPNSVLWFKDTLYRDGIGHLGV